MTRTLLIFLGGAASVAASSLWHLAGAGDRMAERADVIARRTLDYYELPMVAARMDRTPFTRRMILSGPADDFQRSELVRIMNDIPGILDARWDPASLPQERRMAP